MPTYRLTNNPYVLYSTNELLEDNSNSYSSDKTTIITAGKSAIGTKIVFRPGRTFSYLAGFNDFDDISLSKSGFVKEPYPMVVINNTYNAGRAIYAGSITRVGQRISLNATISGVRLSFTKTGNPPGTCYVRIRKVSDDSIIAETSMLVTNLHLTREQFMFNNPVTVAEEVRINFEYNDGDVNNCLNIQQTTPATISGSVSMYSTDYFDNTGYSLFIHILGVPTGGSYAAGSWTFNVKLESTTKYGFRGQMRVRISRGSHCSGSGGTLVALVEQSSSSPTIIPSSAGGQVSAQWTWDAPQIDLAPGEFMVFEFGFNITTAATSNTAQMIFICDEDPAVGNESIVTTTWTPTSNDPTLGMALKIDGLSKAYSIGQVRVDGALHQISNIWTRIDGVLKVIELP